MGKGLTEYAACTGNIDRTRRASLPIPTSLQAIAQKAKTKKQHRFGNLYELLNEAWLKECWRDIRKDAAYGVDRVSARDYEQNLDENLRHLAERLKRKAYRAKLVRRKYIPKGEGKFRALGIPATEDRLLQLAVARLLESNVRTGLSAVRLQIAASNRSAGSS